MEDQSTLRVGSLVSHESFGYGVILDLSGSCECRRQAIVEFGCGDKRLLLRYAPLTDTGWICTRQPRRPVRPPGVDDALWAAFLASQL